MTSTVPKSIEEAEPSIKGMFPGLYWNEDRDEKKWNRIDEIMDQIEDADAIGVVDTDSDGLACEVVLREKFDNPVVIGAGSNDYGISYTHAMNIISEADTKDTPVIVADLSPDSTFSSFLGSLAKINSEVRVYDHHEWDWSAKTSIEAVTDELVIEENKCAAQVLQENIYPDADEQMKEFLEVTADHDLWIKEDERSDHLSTLSFCLSTEEYVNNAIKYGADMVEESDDLEKLYEESEKEAESMAEVAVEKAEWFSVEDADVAITYFNCHQSRVGDKLIDRGADIAIIIQPTLSVSFRSTEEYDVSAQLADGLGGGGHKKAAGASVYNMVEVNEKEGAKYHFEELGENPDDIDVTNMDVFEYTWRTEGEYLIRDLKSYTKNKLTEIL